MKLIKSMMRNRYYLVTITTCIAFFVIILGAYTRLSDAGLGCPDWPGCYGNLIAPTSANSIEKSNQLYSHMPVHSAKAWTEMVHRYFAGILGICIFFIAGMNIMQKQKTRPPISIPLILVGLVIFQAVLGMWTVTWQLVPWVVLAHLLGGLSILSCLFWYRLQLLRSNYRDITTNNNKLLPWIGLAILIVLIQITLGGWVSTNYAGLACSGFPLCNGQLFPSLNFSQAFPIHQPGAMNYTGGVLSSSGRITIQMLHRWGALITMIYLGAITLWIILAKHTTKLRPNALVILILLFIQLCLGVINVTHLLPLWAAVAHNGVAILLFIALLALLYKAKHESNWLSSSGSTNKPLNGQQQSGKN